MDKKKIKYQKTNLCLNTNRLKIHLTYAYQMDLCVVTHPDKGHKKCILVPVGKFTHGTIKAFCLNVT